MTSPMGTLLRTREHGPSAQLEALRGALVRARAPGAGMWDRWAAAHYVEREFGPWFGEKRRLVDGALAERSGQPATTWALGELVALLLAHLADVVHLARSAEAFDDATTKLLRALDSWEREVETLAGGGALTPSHDPSLGAWRRCIRDPMGRLP